MAFTWVEQVSSPLDVKIYFELNELNLTMQYFIVGRFSPVEAEMMIQIELCCEKTCLRFDTNWDLNSHRRWLEA